MNTSPNITARLYEILHNGFGFSSFRPYQEDVCRSAAEGNDLLLVMPTGAGKSLCYQIPGLARQDTTLVISPLLALIEDQVTKLNAMGFKAERIHSGREREASRQVCIDYLQGHLDFLFIAPERLAVPGSIEMLAKRKLALIAIDEAHCISQWGHDFRPEYRMLGQRLKALRPTPIIALTATATPQVQKDICEQLGIPSAKRFVHGFRRTNIAIEVAEENPGSRIEMLFTLLESEDRRPAIVYAPTRKRAEETADALKGRYKAAAYHAGLSADKRERVQTAFLTGKLDVIVATIAFGMGIDKPNVRTVAHLALPASVEGYYQEIGRAGRDGEPSRAVLFYSFIDRKTHEFFFERDYPDVSVLDSIFKNTTTDAIDADTLRMKSKVDSETFEKALEKLWIQGGIQIDQDQNVSRGNSSWRTAYIAHCEHRKNQLEHMTKFASGSGCRMLHLVRHFGDQEDSGLVCGICDVCSQSSVLVARLRPLSVHEEQIAGVVLRALSDTDFSPATGTLFRDNFNEKETDRRLFERVLGALERAKLVRTYEDSFEKNNQNIRFRRVAISTDGLAAIREELRGLSETVQIADGPTLKKPTKKSAKKKKVQTHLPDIGAKIQTSYRVDYNSDDSAGVSPKLVEALKAWRLAEARAKRIPAFRILSDRVLLGIAVSRPSDHDELIAIHGFGPKMADKYGQQILSIVNSEAK